MGPLVMQVNLHGVEEITIDDRGLLAGKDFAFEENLADIEPVAQKMTERAAGERDASDLAPASVASQRMGPARKRYRIVVADDGAGLPEGVTWPVPGKIGALIVQTLRENAKTDLNVESAPDKGVRVTISFDHKAPTRQTN
jgi:hypothetical protein